MNNYQYFINFILLCLIFISGCSEKTEIEFPPVEIDSTLIPDSELMGATTYIYDGSRKTAKIKTGKIIKFEKIDSTMAYQVDAIVYDSLGELSSTIVGDSGLINEKRGRLELFGNVVVISTDSMKLETEYLSWSSKTRKIESDKFVKITKEGVIDAQGYGLEADQDLFPFKILNASGTVHETEDLEK